MRPTSRHDPIIRHPKLGKEGQRWIRWPQQDLEDLAESGYRDWVHELIAAARAGNPTNVGLLKVSAAIGLEPGAPPAAALVPDGALATVSENLERMIDPQRGIPYSAAR